MEKLIQYATKGAYYDGRFDSVVGWAAAGMGYILVTRNRKLVVIDGGNREDGEDFLALLRKYGGEEPAVDLWIMTHPHLDHYGALLALAGREERPALAIRKLAYAFPRAFRNAKGEGIEEAFLHFDLIRKAFPSEIRRPLTGEVMDVDGMKIEFFFTPDDVTILDNPNQLSLIFQVTGEKKKVLFTGDAYRRNLEIVLWREGEEKLRSDVLQMPHHGLCDTGYAPFYRAVGAKTLLIPISIAGDRTMHSDAYGDEPADNLFAERNAERILKAFEGTREIALA
ncbi:MAG: MBL fold metallo-hydrolase [Clostridia bacterium]|nr:MBL fold metallo-hydrolase [Clostridia bacterium]